MEKQELNKRSQLQKYLIDSDKTMEDRKIHLHNERKTCWINNHSQEL